MIAAAWMVSEGGALREIAVLGLACLVLVGCDLSWWAIGLVLDELASQMVEIQMMAGSLYRFLPG